MTDNVSRIGSVDTDIIIDASPDRVWRALTDEIGSWWPDEFYAGGETGKRSFSLEAEPGGRMFEAWDSGGTTRLAFSETIVGNVTADTLEEKKKGWQYLCATLKAHVEGQPAPVWGTIDRP